jgi:hypothetical protein
MVLFLIKNPPCDIIGTTKYQYHKGGFSCASTNTPTLPNMKRYLTLKKRKLVMKGYLDTLIELWPIKHVDTGQIGSNSSKFKEDSSNHILFSLLFSSKNPLTLP